MADHVIVLKRDQYETKDGWLRLNQEISDWCLHNLTDYWGLEFRIKQMPALELKQPLKKFIPPYDPKTMVWTIKSYVEHIEDRRQMQYMYVAMWGEIQFTSEDDYMKFKIFWT